MQHPAVIALLRAHWPWVVAAFFVVTLVRAWIGRRQYVWTLDDTGRSMLNSLAEPYWLRVLVGFDVWANIWLRGRSCMTISTRVWIWSLRPHGHLAQKVVNWWLANAWQADHGLQAASGDIGRCQQTIREIEAALAAYRQAHPNP